MNIARDLPGRRCRPARLSSVLLLALATAACGAGGPGTGAADRTPAAGGSTARRMLLPAGSGGVNTAEMQDRPYVVLVSLDGFRHDYMDRFPTPNLDRIAEAGVRSEGLVPAFPVKTFPNHYTIATGLHPDAHGLVGNSFLAPDVGPDAFYSLGNRDAVEDGRYYRGEPIWVTAETQGMVAASFFFVGTEAPVMGIQPTYWYPFDDAVAYPDRVDRVLAWLAEPAETRPHMVTLYFEETDSKGHNFPTEAPEMAEAVATVDRMIGRLLDGIQALPHGDRVHVVVVSDHGMAPFYADSTYVVPELWDVPGSVTFVGGGSHMIAYVDDTPEAVAAMRDTLDALMPRTSVYQVGVTESRGGVPRRLRYSRGGERLGDLVFVPDPHWAVSSSPRTERPPRDGWTHGWHRDMPEMQGLFVAMGPRIRDAGVIGPVENVHIYPMLAEILGLEPAPEVDGSLEAVRGFLAPPG